MAKREGGMRTVFKVISKYDPLWIFCTFISPTYFGNLPLAQVCSPLWIEICHEITSPRYDVVPLCLLLPLYSLWGSCQLITELPGLFFSHLGNKNNISYLTSLDHCDLGGKGMNCARTLHKQNETGLITRLLFRKTEKHHGSQGDIFNITVIVITECVTFKSCWPRVWELVLHFDGAL